MYFRDFLKNNLGLHSLMLGVALGLSGILNRMALTVEAIKKSNFRQEGYEQQEFMSCDRRVQAINLKFSNDLLFTISSSLTGN